MTITATPFTRASQVNTMKELREALMSPVEREGGKFFTFETQGNALAVVPYEGVLMEELDISSTVRVVNAFAWNVLVRGCLQARQYMYHPTEVIQKLMAADERFALPQVEGPGQDQQLHMHMLAMLQQMQGGMGGGSLPQ